MHIPDNYLSPSTCAVMFAAMVPVWTIAVKISNRTILFDENHTIAADMPSEKLLEDIDLLKEVNLVDQYYHCHQGAGHKHFHDHNF